EAVQQAVVITHNNTEAVAGATAVAYMVARSARGDLDLDTAIKDTREFIGNSAVSRNLAKAETLLKDRENIKPEEALELLGTSGYVVETVASAAFCFLFTPRDFKSTVVNAVLGGIDADTTAAVAGAISGAFNGLNGIPQNWVKELENRELLASMASKLYGMCKEGGRVKHT
ncbi:MAG: ADP-ribosylglycohydrolase family protein, partial [Candidatus Brocadiales bacterium]